ncbi:pyridoxamine 5'-phosphate oxidase [Ramaria rubella]|nr:pyridoxamine 5'-phosphate oxidase [Ramaria rubella]
MSGSDLQTRDFFLSPSTVSPSPIVQFQHWLAEALETPNLNPREFCLATSTLDGIPSARIVVLKHVDERGFTFHTHYGSPKSHDLMLNPRAALTFFWAPLKRSVRVVGKAERVSAEESDGYFLGRPRGGLLAAWASIQSSVVREGEVTVKVEDLGKVYEGREVPRPDHWGGWRIVPQDIEFWRGSMEDRLHDRVRYRLSPQGNWIIERLAP